MQYLYGFVVLIALWGNFCQCQSPYQVSLRLNNPNPSEPTSFCSGAIVHESYILTSANCMFSSNNYPLQPNALHIVAGNFSSSPFNTRQVSTIYIHERFNASSWENDIALLRLTQPLSLRNNTQMRWLQLDNGQSHRESCWASFLIPSARGYPYTSPQQCNVLDNWFCNATAPSRDGRRDQICAHYVFSDSSLCRAPAEQLLRSEDRGTPLICSNVLTGILSTVLPASNTSANVTGHCPDTRKTLAYFANVSEQQRWVNQKISSTNPIGQPSIIPPYSAPTGNGYYGPPAVGVPAYPQPPQHPLHPQQPQPQPQPPTHSHPKGSGAASIVAWSLSSFVAICVAKAFF